MSVLTFERVNRYCYYVWSTMGVLPDSVDKTRQAAKTTPTGGSAPIGVIRPNPFPRYPLTLVEGGLPA